AEIGIEIARERRASGIVRRALRDAWGICVGHHRGPLHRRQQHHVARNGVGDGQWLVVDRHPRDGRNRTQCREQAGSECRQATGASTSGCRRPVACKASHGDVPLLVARTTGRSHHLATTLACSTTTARSLLAPCAPGLWLRAKMRYIASWITAPPPPPYWVDAALEPRPSSS